MTKAKYYCQKGDKLTPRKIKSLIADGLKKILVSTESLMGKFIGETLTDTNTGEVLAQSGDEISEELLEQIKKRKQGIKVLKILKIDADTGPWLRNTLALDKSNSYRDALVDIQKSSYDRANRQHLKQGYGLIQKGCFLILTATIYPLLDG